MLALGLNGLALVSVGEIDEGMRRIDAAAAAAVGGEMTDADSIETVCCFALDACKRVRDLERANEWCLRVRDIAIRFGDRQMFSVCRTHYADVLLWHGEWERAERGTDVGRGRARRDPPGARASIRSYASPSCGVGRDATAEAEELLARVASHRFHALVEGLLALDRGDAETARDAAARLLRRIGGADRFERVAGLELMVRAVRGRRRRRRPRERPRTRSARSLRRRPTRRSAPRPFSPTDGSPQRKARPRRAALIEDARRPLRRRWRRLRRCAGTARARGSMRTRRARGGRR